MNNNYSLLSVLMFPLISQASEAPKLETVWVKATRQTLSAQQVPVSLEVVGSDQISSGLVKNTVDIGFAVAGLTTSQYTSPEPQYFIRGVGSTGSSASEDHSVVVFSDDAYMGRTGSTALGFLDLERVEVLKGPQGTLFGRNAAAGVIQIVPKKPSAARDGYVSLTGGDLGRREFRFAYGGEVHKHSDGDLTTGRVAVSHSRLDGDVENQFTSSSNLRETESSAIRTQLAHQVNDALSWRISAEYTEQDETGPSPRKASTENNPLVIGGFIPVLQPNSDVDSVTLAIDGFSEQQVGGVSFHLDWNSEALNLSSVTSWRNADFSVEEDVSALGFIILTKDENSDLYTQEIRLHSSSRSHFNWSTGIFFLREEVDRIDTTDLSAISDLVNLNPTVIGLPSGFTIPDERASYDQIALNESVAMFGEIEVPLAEQFSLLVGARYTYDSKELTVRATGADPLAFGLLEAGPYSDQVNRSFNDLSGKLSLLFRSKSGLFSYLQLSNAYKAGGFDGNASSVEALRSGFEPESVTSFEWGVKTDFLENRLRLNSALFFIEYEDLQVFQVTNSGTTLTSNAAKAEIYGFEFDIQAQLNVGFYSELSCSVLNTEYTEFVSDVDDNFDGLPDDLAGNKLTRSPDSSCAAGFSWSPNIKGKRPLDIRINYTYQDDVFITPQNRPFDTIESYGLANLHVDYRLNDTFSTALLVTNLSDERYKLHTFDADPLLRNNVESSVYARGRLWAVTVRGNF